jgi:hypothetical protein
MFDGCNGATADGQAHMVRFLSVVQRLWITATFSVLVFGDGGFADCQAHMVSFLDVIQRLWSILVLRRSVFGLPLYATTALQTVVLHLVPVDRQMIGIIWRSNPSTTPQERVHSMLIFARMIITPFEQAIKLGQRSAC